MYVRRTSIKSRSTGEPYYTYRLVESVRDGGAVRQRTLLNLGRHFEIPREQWLTFARRIEQLVHPQADQLPVPLANQWEARAEHYAALLVYQRVQLSAGEADYQCVDLNALECIRPCSVGTEHIALETVRALGLEAKLAELGFNRPQRAAALGNLIARLAAPGSELATEA